MGCIPTLWFRKIKYSNKYIFISYILTWNGLKPLNSRIYKNKTTFVWCTVWQYHFVWGGGRCPFPLINDVPFLWQMLMSFPSGKHWCNFLLTNVDIFFLWQRVLHFSPEKISLSLTNLNTFSLTHWCPFPLINVDIPFHLTNCYPFPLTNWYPFPLPISYPFPLTNSDTIFPWQTLLPISLDKFWYQFPLTNSVIHFHWQTLILFSPDKLCSLFPLTNSDTIFPWQTLLPISLDKPWYPFPQTNPVTHLL